MNLEIGQRIEVFEVLSHEGYEQNIFQPKTFRIGDYADYSIIVDVLGNDGIMHPLYLKNPDEIDECRPVGCLTIKSIK